MPTSQERDHPATSYSPPGHHPVHCARTCGPVGFLLWFGAREPEAAMPLHRFANQLY